MQLLIAPEPIEKLLVTEVDRQDHAVADAFERGRAHDCSRVGLPDAQKAAGSVRRHDDVLPSLVGGTSGLIVRVERGAAKLAESMLRKGMLRPRLERVRAAAVRCATSAACRAAT